MNKLKILIIKWFGKKHGAQYCPHICKICAFYDECDFWKYASKK